MSNSLEHLIAQLRELPEDEQDFVANIILSYLADEARLGQPQDHS